MNVRERWNSYVHSRPSPYPVQLGRMMEKARYYEQEGAFDAAASIT